MLASSPNLFFENYDEIDGVFPLGQLVFSQHARKKPKFVTLVLAFGAFVRGLSDADVEIPTSDPLERFASMDFCLIPMPMPIPMPAPVMPLLYLTRCMRAQDRICF